jgi:hypothetical protein
MPTFLFKDAEGNVEATVSAPPGSFVYACCGLTDPTMIQVGDSVRIGGGGFRKVDEIIPDEV